MIDPDPERTSYIVDRWDVSRKAAVALQLSEIGLSAAGVARVMDVTEGTANKYLSEAEDEINERVTETITLNKPKYDVYPDRELV